MKKTLILTALLFFIFVLPAGAHPLGNFSVNNFSRLEVADSSVKVFTVLDLAEIPTFQESVKIDTDKNGVLSSDELDVYAAAITPDYLQSLSLKIDGAAVELHSAGKHSATVQKGAGDLDVLRIEMFFAGKLVLSSLTAQRIEFANNNFVGRVGWNEIAVNRAAGINIFNSSVYADSLSQELRAYPEDLLMNPLSERVAAFSVTTGELPVNAKPLQSRSGQIVSAPAPKDRFAALISVPEITPTIVLLGLLIAFALGAAHALSPGHGKAVVGAYLVGSKGTAKHAAFLGLTVTVTHTLGVFALGLITLFAANFILPERLMPFLNFVSGLLVFFIGVSLLKNRLLKTFGLQHSHEIDDYETHSHGGYTHTHGGTTHSHQPPERVTWASLLGLGISGGLLPCPSALVLMLSAISLGRVGYGLLLTVAFSFGLAATLTAVGLVFLYVGKLFDRPALAENRFVKTLPVVSAFIVACFGAVICYNSLA